VADESFIPTNEPTNEWVSCYFLPEVDDCLLDLKLADGSIIMSVRYSNGQLVGNEDCRVVEFVQWRFHV